MKMRDVLIIGCLLGLAVASYAAARPARADDPSFSFTVAGDYASSPRTDTVLNGIKMAAPNFNIAVGDFSYSSTSSEQAWCDYVRSKVGNDLPFELISGNHEDDPAGDGKIDNFAACLPDKIGNITGTYAKEYYFDYAGLARFILISPNLKLDGQYYDYVEGNPHYDWLSAAIDDAHSSGIKWVIVVNHENCISMGVKACETGPDLLNLLLSKRVDLMLQGHDHDYQRSKQLALGTGCSAIVPDSYNPSCVANDGSTNTYVRGAGSVLTIVGTGGTGYDDVDPGDA
ncbi:MAG TPA: metallophosphoesterase [Candidatus Limnocylindrales bacterium]